MRLAAAPSEEQVAAALAQFDQVWDALSPREQAAVVEQLIEQVEFDSANGQVQITFHNAGLDSLAAIQVTEETAA